MPHHKNFTLIIIKFYHLAGRTHQALEIKAQYTIVDGPAAENLLLETESISHPCLLFPPVSGEEVLHHFQISREESKRLKDIEERLLAIREEKERILQEEIVSEKLLQS